MSDENRAPIRQFVQIRDACESGKLASEVEDNLQSQLLNLMLSSSEVNRKINAIVFPTATQEETLIQSVRELN